VQAHANQWENRFKLNIPEFQGWLQPEDFLVTEKIEKIDKKKVLREAAEIRSQSVEEEEDGFIGEDCSIGGSRIGSCEPCKCTHCICGNHYEDYCWDLHGKPSRSVSQVSSQEDSPTIFGPPVGFQVQLWILI
jgi:hypothetical protein